MSGAIRLPVGNHPHTSGQLDYTLLIPQYPDEPAGSRRFVPETRNLPLWIVGYPTFRELPGGTAFRS
jgi:hypothetical protein